MNRWIRIGVSAVVLLALALGFVMSFDASRADAAPTRPAAPLISARSAGLVAQHGMVQLRAAGAPSREAVQAAQTRMQDRQKPGMGDSWQNVQNIVGEMCGKIHLEVLYIDISGLIQGICKVLGGGLLGIWKIGADLLTSITFKILKPVFKWVMTTAIGGAVGYDSSCTNAGANAPGNCTGADTKTRILSVPKLDTAKAILMLSLMMGLPVLLIAVISALVKLSFAELGKTLLRLPVVWIVAGVAVVIIAAAAGLRDGIVTYIVNQSHMMDKIKSFMDVGGDGFYVAYEDGILPLLAFFASIIGGILLFIIFMVGDIVVLATVLFIPLAAVGLLWSGTAKWFKRVIELSFAFIIGKVIVVGVLALSFDLLVTK